MSKPLCRTPMWKSVRFQFERITLPKIRSNAEKLQCMADNGNADAQQILRYAKLIDEQFDPMLAIKIEAYQAIWDELNR
jgi:hypothetical protein